MCHARASFGKEQEVGMPRIDITRVEPGGNLFGGDASWHDAILSVYHPSWGVYAEGYRLAADRVLELALEKSSQRDFLIYPVCFLYRQFLELSLKEVIRYAEELAQGEAGRTPDHHRLDGLWSRFKNAMGQVTDGSLDDEIAVIENAVLQFAQLDPSSQAFRYPADREGEPVRHIRERVNLPSLRKEMANAAKAVQMVSGGLSAMVDLQRDMYSDMGP